ncbi:MAG TPA: amidase [Methylomirabilota bacterium]|jgi:aspartyl-tRNA(Asn)/glutamyl-tRNA(Gln) amidotransferase subunit A|nr:amidase [Methylomirabilota bacterium]
MPSTEDLTSLEAREAARRIRDGGLSAVALVEAHLARIRALEPEVHAWVHVDEQGALAAARERDATRGRDAGPLSGVPVGIKDIIDVRAMPTTAGADPVFHTRPADDAPAVARLRRAGAIILGKTVTTEFAFRNPRATANPWNRAHTPGGSSSGSAAAVASRMVPLALGSQTVGSVLRPAAYCGVVGFKAAHGLVPTEGVVPLAWSLDHVGIFARSVDDAATLISVLTERDLTPTAVTAPRLALAPDLLRRATPETAEHVQAMADRFAKAGAKVVEITLPESFATIHAVGQTILETEAGAFHEEHLKAHAAELGADIRALAEAGRAVRAIDYVRADRARRVFRAAMQQVLAAHDALISPTAPSTAPAGLGHTGDASLCAPWSTTGVPAISLPSGVAPSGLPLAVQLVNVAGDSSRLLGIAAWCERVLGFTARPGL